MNLLAQTNPWDAVSVSEHLFLYSPLIALVCTMLAIVTCPLIAGRGARPIATVTTLGVLITLILSVFVAMEVPLGGVSSLSTDADAGVLVVDGIASGFQIILLVFMAGVMWLWWIGSSEKERNAPEFFILLLGSALGMALMVSTTNLLMIVVAIELASLPSYALVGFDKRDRIGAEASLKYMIFGAVCAAVMLYGVSLLYGMVGTLEVTELARHTVNNLVYGGNRLLLGTALACFFVGIAFKVSAVPCHFWCPDAFEGAKVEVTTWLSVASKAAGVILLARLVPIFCAAVPAAVQMEAVRPLAWGIGIVAAITCTVGNFSAYRQQSVKRLLAYSSIAHAGYMMMAAAVFMHTTVSGHEVGMTSLLIYVVIYLFMNLGAFGVTALVAWETGSDHIDSFTGLARRAPWLAVPMIICLMSLVGLPPLAGFLGKWWILVALGAMEGTASATSWSSYDVLGWFLIIIMVLNTLLSLYYYMRIVVRMSLHDDERPALRPSIRGLALVNGCAVVLLALFFFGNPLKSTAEKFSKGMYNPNYTQVIQLKPVSQPPPLQGPPSP